MLFFSVKEPQCERGLIIGYTLCPAGCCFMPLNIATVKKLAKEWSQDHTKKVKGNFPCIYKVICKEKKSLFI